MFFLNRSRQRGLLIRLESESDFSAIYFLVQHPALLFLSDRYNILFKCQFYFILSTQFICVVFFSSMFALHISDVKGSPKFEDFICYKVITQ